MSNSYIEATLDQARTDLSAALDLIANIGEPGGKIVAGALLYDEVLALSKQCRAVRSEGAKQLLALTRGDAAEASRLIQDRYGVEVSTQTLDRLAGK